MPAHQKLSPDHYNGPPTELLLGIALDLSGSMRVTAVNRDGMARARIEEFSKTFAQAVQDIEFALDTVPRDKQVPPRLFIHGYGFVAEKESTWQDSIGDVFTALMAFDDLVARYHVLQVMLEKLWSAELKALLEIDRVRGNAEKELIAAVKQELERHAPTIRRPWYAFLSYPAQAVERGCLIARRWIDSCQVALQAWAAGKGKLGSLLTFALCALLDCSRLALRIPAALMLSFSYWVEDFAERLRSRMTLTLEAQADQVVIMTRDTYDDHREEIIAAIRTGIKDFIDRQAFKYIHLYDKFTDLGNDAEYSLRQVRRAFERDKKALRATYREVSRQIGQIIEADVGAVWSKSESTHFLKKAAHLLQIEPDYALLRRKTEKCVRQVIWEQVRYKVNEEAEDLARERFTRAALITGIQRIKDNETTLSLREVCTLIKQQSLGDERKLLNALPIFGESPMGHALAQTYLRMRCEVQTATGHGQELYPVIILISDGMPTDEDKVDILSLAAAIKKAGIPIICCLVMDGNVGRPRILRNQAGWQRSMVIYALSLIVWMCWISVMKLLNAGKKLLIAVKKRLRASYLVFALSALAGIVFAAYSNARKTRHIRVSRAWVLNIWAALSARLRRVDIRVYPGLLLHRCMDAGKQIKAALAQRFSQSFAGQRLAAAQLMYDLATCVDDAPDLKKRLEGGFRIEKHAKLLLQINHTRYLRDFINAMLSPIENED
jgi:hypothetical protein